MLRSAFRICPGARFAGASKIEAARGVDDVVEALAAKKRFPIEAARFFSLHRNPDGFEVQNICVAGSARIAGSSTDCVSSRR
jgi:hypothetical protein